MIDEALSVAVVEVKVSRLHQVTCSRHTTQIYLLLQESYLPEEVHLSLMHILFTISGVLLDR